MRSRYLPVTTFSECEALDGLRHSGYGPLYQDSFVGRHTPVLQYVDIYKEHTEEEMNVKKCLLPPQQNLSQKTKQHRQTTTDMKNNMKTTSKAQQGANNYSNNRNTNKNMTVTTNKESESSEEEENPPNIIQADTSAGRSITPVKHWYRWVWNEHSKKGKWSYICYCCQGTPVLKDQISTGKKHGIQLGLHVNLRILVLALQCHREGCTGVVGGSPR